jgi:hypothetical protein
MLVGNTTENFIDILDRELDCKSIHKEVHRAEIGLRAIGLMYHDHSTDDKSNENIYILKDNIHYRLLSAAHQYVLFLREIDLSEMHLQRVTKDNPNILYSGFGHPVFDQTEIELSSIFDSIIFHLSSVFDYLSHSICYMYYSNKQKTDYWTKLSRIARDEWKDKYTVSPVLDEIDRKFVGKLYDYRSRLLHNKRDKHQFASTIRLDNHAHSLKITCSDVVLKHFKLIKEEVEENVPITLTYMASWLIKRTLIEIENILGAIKTDLESNSSFQDNLRKPKSSPGFNTIMIDPVTKRPIPMSSAVWEEYKAKKQ